MRASVGAKFEAEAVRGNVRSRTLTLRGLLLPQLETSNLVCSVPMIPSDASLRSIAESEGGIFGVPGVFSPGWSSIGHVRRFDWPVEN